MHSAQFEPELTIERGRGYVSAAQNRNDDAEVGRIPVDSIYSPEAQGDLPRRGNRAGERTDFDRLVVDVETKPAISPRDAIVLGWFDAGRAVRSRSRAQHRRRGR